ncbi:progesterone binding protein [Sistotremastrum niveocremeum HHB9708]|uniref:Progesterone binding protein n=2 Tax=Sistotremastraceae TaxID=3402574 RepID=A0A165A969_9AGAM|nr:progesterone binding protein [Sistotremastrum niveocremeum HHB9708]KZT42523.1 cytochrome b5 [Sistotremastrum suecicum HHB10207 ss-3]
MSQPASSLPPPKDDPYTLAALKEFDGSNPSKPIFVSIKGTVFDVTSKKDTYGAGCSYNVFAGKDGSRALGKSTLKEDEAIPDYSGLNEAEMKILNDWHGFFSKRYPIVGRVTDLPPAVANL